MEKVFRDSIHDLIRFDMDRDRLLLALIDTAEVQRLRNIRQMGVSDLIYPGATHSRFSHSLGVAHLMRCVIEQMGLLRSNRRFAAIANSLDEHRDVLLAAAVLHDIGHFPYSHLLEEIVAIDHETLGIRLIEDHHSEVHQLLRNADSRYPEQVSKILSRTYKPSYVVKLISSQLDVDRMDYLLRDSFYTGVGYGKFDLDWLLHSLRIVETGDDYEVAVDAHKGVQVAESYVLARYYMYQQVYHHKTERSAGALLFKLLQRAKELLEKDRLPHTPQTVKDLLQHPDALDRKTFLTLTDVVMGYAISVWASSEDSILSDLSQRFVTRQMYKTLPMTYERFKDLQAELNAVAQHEGFDPEYYLIMDSAVDSPYKDPYLVKRDDEASEKILLVDDAGQLCDLSEVSHLIRSLRNHPFTTERLCFPQELRQPLTKFLDAL